MTSRAGMTCHRNRRHKFVNVKNTTEEVGKYPEVIGPEEAKNINPSLAPIFLIT